MKRTVSGKGPSFSNTGVLYQRFKLQFIPSQVAFGGRNNTDLYVFEINISFVNYDYFGNIVIKENLLWNFYLAMLGDVNMGNY